MYTRCNWFTKVLVLALCHPAAVLAQSASVELTDAVVSTASTEDATRAVALTSTGPTSETNILPILKLTVLGRSSDLLGIATSASQGTVGSDQIGTRAPSRTGEILESVPGIIVTQHAGGGKANQYFLRGFNLDHGTDFLTTLDGVPLNMPSHGHGQGYTDLNGVIPELVQRINYQKGVYFAENGDFSSAGAAHLETYDVLPHGLAKVEAGMYGYARALVADSPQMGPGHVLYALELHNYAGPWQKPDNFRRANATLKYSQGNNRNGFSLTGRGYYGVWNSSDQIAASAVTSRLIPIDGTLDPTTGGESYRTGVNGEWHHNDMHSATKVIAYWVRYQMDLYSNFTYYLVDTSLGDQFEQMDTRNIYGLSASHAFHHRLWGHTVSNTFGLQARLDDIGNGLYNTNARQRVDKRDAATGTRLAATVREDSIVQIGSAVYYKNEIGWADSFRTEVGLREDLYFADVASDRPSNSDNQLAQITSPKLTLIVGPWWKTELYLQGGLGYHSNDARGATTHVDPVSGLNTDADGNPIEQADPLVRTMGAEFGVRTLVVPGLQSTVSLWWLDIASELLFVGDAGLTEASRPSQRYGVEFANYYALPARLTASADVSLSHARFRDSDPAGNYIPGAIELAANGGLTYTAAQGWFAGSHLRYFGPRPLIEDNSYRSDFTLLLSANAGYALSDFAELTVEVFNLLNREDHDIDYAYESRVRPTDAAVEEIHYHPVEPISVRAGISAHF